jgi:hypothetical protein
MVDGLSERMVTIHVWSLLLETPFHEPDVIAAAISLVERISNGSNVAAKLMSDRLSRSSGFFLYIYI